MSPPVWGLDNAVVRFGTKLALSDVDLNVAPGDITSVVGGDGAGKTTLARTMVGLVRLDSGRVRRPQIHRIGYQSEASGVWEDLTVFENLDFVGSAHQMSSPDRSRRIDSLLDITTLGPARNRLASSLSGGMQQKLGVAMAMLHEPALLILDEPTTGLDPVSRTELWSLLARAAANGAAILTTTTYLDEAERGSRILALDQGHTLTQGTLDEIRGSVLGVVAAVGAGTDHPFRWRRGREWRAWFPDGANPPGTQPTELDLSDLVTVAAFARREEARS